MWLPLECPLLGTWPTTQACALTGNRTGDPLVHRPMLNPLCYTSQGSLQVLHCVCVYDLEIANIPIQNFYFIFRWYLGVILSELIFFLNVHLKQKCEWLFKIFKEFLACLKLTEESIGTRMDPHSKSFKPQIMSEIRLLNYNMLTINFYENAL